MDSKELHDAYSHARPIDQSLVDDAKTRKLDKLHDLLRVAADHLSQRPFVTAVTAPLSLSAT
ncbi:MAG: hypothetical protein ABWY45_00925 [Mycobacterium sp.]